jgi:hypothetical protein
MESMVTFHAAPRAGAAFIVPRTRLPRPYPLRAWQADSYRVGETLAVTQEASTEARNTGRIPGCP